ncbi:hypothetical protein [Wenyingzhuangia aestuarii]|uniref:hypothetical protein n=1 Tax=Wenyingzhuangia aestuarii TaxID=1647582 RepID=UPI001438DA46|nr:hypothetical protein [Wenyingzhuangia aestuarii]NJB84052.1 hypothetical protein [Wenyingzhuangia aestuarii]
MKKLKNLFKISLIITLLISCSKDNDISSNANKIIYDISINKQNSFIDGEISLTFKTNSYESITVTTDEPNITITQSSDNAYQFSSSQASSGIIEITSNQDNTTQKDQVFVNFLEHGTNYKTTEGVEIDEDNIYKIFLIHGEPEGKSSFTNTTTNQNTGVTTSTTYNYWYYFSKGFYFTSLNSNNTVISVRLMAKDWTATIENETSKNGVPFSYDIDGLGSFTNTGGILMQDVVNKYGEPNVITSEGSNITYKYNDLNSAISGNQFAYFYFESDDPYIYTDKEVSSILID